MSGNLIKVGLLILLSAVFSCSPGLYTRMDSTSPSFGRIFIGMTRVLAEKNLNTSVHTIPIDRIHYRVIYEYETERDTKDAVKLTILDFVTLGMGTLIVTPIDRFKGTSHLMAVDYEREGIHSSDDKVVGIYYKLKNNPNAMVWSDKGFLNTQKKDWEEVIRVSSIAITIDPDLTSPYIYRAGAYSMREEYDKAIKDFNTVLEIDPANALAYNNRGLALEEKGETDAAVKSYEKACELGMEKACENLVRFGDE